MDTLDLQFGFSVLVAVFTVLCLFVIALSHNHSKSKLEKEQ